MNVSRRRAGFTLIELLVASALMALIGGTCVAVLSGGINVWQRAQSAGERDHTPLIVFTQMQRDVRNARRFSPIPAKGRARQYTFAAVGRLDPEAPEEIGQAGYFLDAKAHRLCRTFVPYRSLRRSSLRKTCRPVMEDVASVRFTYFGSKEKGFKPRWSSSWNAPEPPAAVKVSVTRREADGQNGRTHAFVVSVLSVPLIDDDDAS